MIVPKAKGPFAPRVTVPSVLTPLFITHSIKDNSNDHQTLAYKRQRRLLNRSRLERQLGARKGRPEEALPDSDAVVAD